MMQGAFSQRLPEEILMTLKPLRYCQYRVVRPAEIPDPPEVCGIFAVTELHGMSFCFVHGRTVEHGLGLEDQNVSEQQ